jgi:hypothetical protein
LEEQSCGMGQGQESNLDTQGKCRNMIRHKHNAVMLQQSYSHSCNKLHVACRKRRLQLLARLLQHFARLTPAGPGFD